MDTLFDVWKKYLKDNEVYLRAKSEPLIADLIAIDGEQVERYQSNFPGAGMWLQDQSGYISIYSTNREDECIRQRKFFHEIEMGPIHVHDSIEIGYVVEGCAKQEFSGKIYEFNKGDFWIVDSNCYHRDIYTKTDLFTVYISVSEKVFDSAFLGIMDNSEIYRFLCLTLSKQKTLRQFLHFMPRGTNVNGAIWMEQLLKEIVEKKIGYENIVSGLIERLLYCLSMEYDYILSSQEKQKKNALLFQKIEEYIQNHFQTVTIQKLIDQFHYNEDFYNRLIKKYSGYTYSEYVKNIRLQKAERLLLETKISIEEIAYLLGYQSRGYFYKIFTETHGITPAKYRNQKTGKN